MPALGLVIMAGMSTTAQANYINTEASCSGATLSSPEFVGRVGNLHNTSQATDGNGTFSLIAGCNATGGGTGSNGYANTAIGGLTTATSEGATAVGFHSSATARFASAFGLESVASSSGATALGFGANAQATNAVAIGGASDGTSAGAAGASGGTLSVANSTTASGVGAIAIGSNTVKGAQATSKGAIALGGESAATSSQAIAIGEGTTSSGSRAVSLGSSLVASAENSVVIGNNSSIGTNAVSANAIGDSNTISDASKYASVLGMKNDVDGNAARVLGNNNTVGADFVGVSGSNNTISATSMHANVMGNNATVNGVGATVVGSTGTASADHTLVLGSNGIASAVDAIAIGHGANASEASSVALGSGTTTEKAVGTANATVAGKQYLFAGSSPTGTISVGSAATTDSGGNPVASTERTITHVAAGRLSATSTDAVNGSQLHATNQAVDLARTDIDALGTTVSSHTTTLGEHTTAITNLQGGVTSLQQGSVSYLANGDGTFDTSKVVLDKDGTTIDNLNAGALTADSQEAVNGAQLFATNELVKGNTTALGNLTTSVGDNATAISNLTTSVDGNSDRLDEMAKDSTYYQANSTAAGAMATGAESLSMGPKSAASAVNSVAIGNGANASVSGGVALGSGAVSSRTVSPATGSISAGSATITYNTSDKTLLGAVSVGSDDEYRQITHVADGIEDQDAVTMRQLQGALGSLTVGGGNKYFHANSTNPSDSAAVGSESIAVGPGTVVNGDGGLGMGDRAAVDQSAVGGIAIGQRSHSFLEDAIAIGTSSEAQGQLSVALGAGAKATGASGVALGSNSVADAAVATSSITLAGTDYTFAGSSPIATVGIGSAGQERTLTHLAAGRVSASSTDAINGSQLYATNQAVEGVSSRVDDLEGQYASLSDDALTYDSGSDKGSITLGGESGTSLTNLADGDISSGSTDAVTGGQLWNLSQQLSGAGGGGGIYSNISTSGPGAQVDADDGIAMGGGARVDQGAEGGIALGSGSVADRGGMNGAREAFSDVAVGSTAGALSVGSAGGERQITNVAGGTEATDAVNVRQLESVQAGAVNYDRHEDGSVDYGSVTLGDATAGPTTVHNVGPGVADTDAANVGQLNALNQNVQRQFSRLAEKIGDVEDDANAGSATAIAMASVPQAYLPGRSMVAVGGGNYSGESAAAVGVSHLTENGKWAFKINGSGDTQGNVGIGVGAGFHW
ncbi:YadA-like family protein [Halomonas sp. DP8Y7-3]|uniref:YadA family autotransporter adhesin n=1 Tax=Halomonas sp. DP8Y7-3 TaxID=2859079 RepID=UPI001C979514|nr:YadA-like family protein [Halomonas sp. DP8Y7-3]MBY5927918.1 YadA-like family protein [Halomonas sp. DP8Y7-3]